MDDELLHLEAELRRLRPAKPSRELGARLEHELSRNVAPRSRAAVRWLWLAALPAAATLVIGITRWSSRSATADPAATELTTSIGATDPASPADRASLRPVTAQNILVSARDEGVVTLADGTPARRNRLRYVDTITWKDPRTNASLTWSVPREEVRVVPVVLQ